MSIARLKLKVRPNPVVLKKDDALRDLLSLVVEEYIMVDLFSTLTVRQRFRLAHWASVCHVGAGFGDPPMRREKPPKHLGKVVLLPGRTIIIEGLGEGIIEEYTWDWGQGTTMGLGTKRPKVKLKGGGIVYPELKEIIGVGV